jgi:polyferredoxin
MSARVVHAFSAGVRCMRNKRNGKQLDCISTEEGNMSVGTIVLILFILILLGALPTWPYSGGWGYYPSGGAGLIVVILVVLLLMGRI